MIPNIDEFVVVADVLSRAPQGDKLLTAFPELKIAQDVISQTIQNSAASSNEKAEAWLLSCARNAGADISVEAATYLARAKKLSSEIVDCIADTWRRKILHKVAGSQVHDSVRVQAESGALSLMQAAEVMLSSEHRGHARFMSAPLSDEHIIDAAMLRATDSLDLGAFAPWAMVLLDELSDGPEGIDHNTAGVWLFAMMRADYALRNADADGLKSWLRALAKGSVDRERPWRTRGRSGHEDSCLIAAEFAFVSSRILGRMPSKRREAAVQLLLGTQSSEGFWSNLPLEGSDGAVRHALYTTCCSVHALALVRPAGWGRACERAAGWLASQQDGFGIWNDEIGPAEYLTVLALDSLRLAAGDTPFTFDPEQAISANHNDDSASVTAKVLRLGPRPRILKFLGSGAEADVYLVEDRFKRQVAAKVFYESKRIPEHIYAHAVGLARVPHEAVAELYSIEDVLDQEGQTLPAILMEHLVGEELECRLRREVSVSELVSWGRTLLDVFAAMHSVDHIHRDAHLGNFFITDRGLRVYDVLNSPTAHMRSAEAVEALKCGNARQVRGIIEAIFEKLPHNETTMGASRHFLTRTAKANLALSDVRGAFCEAVEMLTDMAVFEARRARLSE